jgi:hypothetical protein
MSVINDILLLNRRSGAARRYYLVDRFTTPRAAGSVNGTYAEPIGGVRTVTDSGGKMSIAGGVLVGAAGTSLTDPIFSYPVLKRVLGKVLLGEQTVTTFASGGTMGWGITAGLAPTQAAINLRDTTILRIQDSANVYTVGTLQTSVKYSLAIVLRTAGAFFFIKGGLFTYWTLLWTSLNGNTGNLFAEFSQGTSTSNFDNIRVPKRTYISVPLQSDGFSAATTDGAGNAEANGPIGNAYTSVGTWGVSGGKRSCSALDSGVGFSYLPCSSANVMIDLATTRTAANGGIVARYVDGTHNIIAYTEGTNCVCAENTGAGWSTLRTGAVTYGAGKVIRLILDGTTGRLFYDNQAVGASFTVTGTAGLNHGAYTTDTGNSFDNLIVWPRGNENQYSALDAL